MSYGIIEYDKDGKPICEICGKSFLRVLTHVRQKHNISEKEYKHQFGLDVTRGICSKESSELSRQRVYENYSLCITSNLLDRGKNTRFLVGSEGRTADKVSQQTKIRLIKQAKNIK